ncbi:MAG: gliding motility-associated protein GldE [Bacteroidales bacterium]|nr:gliding motility-associated protein GldE [Bacteroidales bacterium]
MDSDYYLSILLNTYESSITTSAIVALIISVLLLYISALLSGSEVALQSLNSLEKEKIEKENSPRNQLIQSLLTKTEEFQTCISIWNNFLNISIIILFFYAFNQSALFTSSLIILIGIGLLFAFILLLLSEIVPKIYAQNNPLKYLQKTAPLVCMLGKITHPLSASIVKIHFSLNNSTKKKSVDIVSVDELSKALELTSEELNEEKDMLEGIINLYNKTAVEIMTPRMDIASLDISASFKEVIGYVVEVEYSRIPIFGNNADDIKGILYIKDLLPYLNQTDNFHWQKLIRPAFFVPESKKIDDLLEEFRTNKNHIAIVIDEYGGTSGIVTMEDILEEIVGEINDEYDDEEDSKYICQEDGSFIFQGKILLTDFFRITNIDPKTFGKLTEEVDSLAGLILEIKGDFPEPDEIISYPPYTFHIIEMDNKRILKILFTVEDLQNNKEKEV